MKIGVIPEWFKLPIEEGIKKAAELGADGVQIYAVHKESGVNLPEYSDQKIAELKKVCDDCGIVFSAICADVLNHDFQINGKNMERAKLTCRIADAARKLNSKVITSHIGVIPEDDSGAVYANMLEAVKYAADHCASIGVVMAIETGPEPAETLFKFIETVNSPGLGVNLDPANFKMVLDYDPVKAVHLLHKYIVHTHAKDGIHIADGLAVLSYGAVNADGSKFVPPGVRAEYKEVALGEGQVPWTEYLAALRQYGYDGFLTVERECRDAEKDIKTAINFLKELI